MALVLGAGSATRMGRDKLALPWGNTTVLDAALAPLLACEDLDEVVVVVSPGGTRADGVRVLVNPEPQEGMGSSLRLGVASTVADGWLIALADMPGVRPDTIRALVRAMTPDGIVVPTADGRRGHPVAIGAAFRDELLAIRGDRGARDVLKRHAGAVKQLAVDDPGIRFDLDTPADLAAHPGPGEGTSP